MNGVEDYYNLLETLVSIFTVDKGVLKVLLMRKKTEPYKGYWLLPGALVPNRETIEDTIDRTIDMQLGLTDIHLEQGHTFSRLDRDHEKRVIATSYIGFVDGITLDLKQIPNLEVKTSWFPVDDIPKMAYDHDEILQDNLVILKGKHDSYDLIKKLFPPSFTFSEFHHVYEQILEKALDRRNFKKRCLSLGILEETQEQYTLGSGRPAKLYCFKEHDQEERI